MTGSPVLIRTAYARGSHGYPWYGVCSECGVLDWGWAAEHVAMDVCTRHALAMHAIGA